MKDVRISIRLSEEDHKKFKIYSVNCGKSMQDIMIELIKKEIKKHEKKS